MLASQDEANPTQCYPAFQQARRQSRFGTHCSTVAEHSCRLTESGAPLPSPWDCSPQGSGCPSLPNRTAHAPHCKDSSQRYGEGCWPHGDQLLYQFPIPWLPSSSQTQLAGRNPFYSPIITLLFPILPAP